MSDLKDFVIEDGVLIDYIGTEVSVIVPEYVSIIGPYAFRFDDQLKSVVIPEGVTEIKSEAFFWCKGLEKIVLPSTLSEISSSGVFQQCINLKEIEAPDNIFEKVWKYLDTKQRISICENSIKCKRELRNLELKTVKKSNGLIKFAIEQDDDCYLSIVLDLKETLPIKAIDEFLEQSKNAPKTKMILIDYKNKYYPPDVVADIEISKTELELGFRERTDEEWKEILTLKNTREGWILTSWRGNDEIVVLPEKIDGKSIIEITEAAFTPLQKNTEAVKQVRNNIRKIVIPEGVKNLGEFEKISCIGAFEGCENLEEVVLPKSLIEIGDRTFKDCKNLKEIVIPNNLKKIGKYALPNTIKNIIVDKNNKFFCAENGYIYNIKKKDLIHAFAENIELIESNIKSIRDDAFKGNTFIKRVSLPKELKEISNCMFYGCTALEEVLLPTSIVKIPTQAFEDCKNLKNINIPNGVKRIERYAFSRCTNLCQVYIPESVEMIGSDVFTYYGKKMAKIKIHAPAGSYTEAYAKKNKIPFVAE